MEPVFGAKSGSFASLATCRRYAVILRKNHHMLRRIFAFLSE